MNMYEDTNTFECSNIKALVTGMNEAQMKIALKYFPASYMTEELERRTTKVKQTLLKVKEEALDIKDDMSLDSAQKKLQTLSSILSMIKE